MVKIRRRQNIRFTIIYFSQIYRVVISKKSHSEVKVVTTREIEGAYLQQYNFNTNPKFQVLYYYLICMYLYFQFDLIAGFV